MRIAYLSLLALAVGIAGCQPCASESPEPEPESDPILAPGSSAMVLDFGGSGGATLWPRDGGVIGLPAGSTVRIVSDPGPADDPDRGVAVYSDARDAMGEISRSQIAPLPPSGQ